MEDGVERISDYSAALRMFLPGFREFLSKSCPSEKPFSELKRSGSGNFCT